MREYESAAVACKCCPSAPGRRWAQRAGLHTPACCGAPTAGSKAECNRHWKRLSGGGGQRTSSRAPCTLPHRCRPASAGPVTVRSTAPPAAAGGLRATKPSSTPQPSMEVGEFCAAAGGQVRRVRPGRSAVVGGGLGMRPGLARQQRRSQPRSQLYPCDGMQAPVPPLPSSCRAASRRPLPQDCCRSGMGRRQPAARMPAHGAVLCPATAWHQE